MLHRSLLLVGPWLLLFFFVPRPVWLVTGKWVHPSSPARMQAGDGALRHLSAENTALLRTTIAAKQDPPVNCQHGFVLGIRLMS